jgi:hypothetical protein
MDNFDNDLEKVIDQGATLIAAVWAVILVLTTYAGRILYELYTLWA